MSSYRFCRTDDIGLLVDALNRCWAPSFPGELPMTAAAFKRSIRDLQVWCSSCMVAFAGADPIGVLIGAKRPSSTLVHRIAVHPDHRRQGHGRHLLESLSSKLAILGPPRIVAEVSEPNAAARALFKASGYVEEAVLTDFVFDEAADRRTQSSASRVASRMVIPITVDDLAANRLLDGGAGTCWERSVEVLTARKDEIEGFAVASEERIEAYVLFIKEGGPIVALRSLVEDDGGRLALLLTPLAAAGVEPRRIPKVHPGEIPEPYLHVLGFRAAGTHLRLAARARSG